MLACFITEGGCNSTADRRCAEVLLFCLGASSRLRATDTHTHRETHKHMLQHEKVAVPEQMLASHLPSLSEPLRFKSVRGFLFWGFICFLLNWGHEMRFPEPAAFTHSSVRGWKRRVAPVGPRLRARCTKYHYESSGKAPAAATVT